VFPDPVPEENRVNPQLEGVESLEGTYLFTLERSGKSLRLNRFLHGLIVPGNRALFRDNPQAAFDQAGLSAEERTLVRELDWAGLIRYGASFFCLEKLARVSGVSNPEIVAAMRGETLEEFLKSRNVPGAR
jgi:gallate dioxygenase